MSASISVVACSCWIVVMACGSVFGQEATPKESKSASLRLKEAQAKLLVEQLGGAKEADRQAAKRKLQAAGGAAIPSLANAAAKGNQHATENAIAILQAHVEGTDAETQQAAFEVLRRLAVGTRPAVAALAKQIVQQHPDLKAKSDAARLASREKRADRAAKQPDEPNVTPRPTSPTPTDPATALRRQSIEQQIKDGEAAIEKIRKLKLSKELESQQISAITLGLQKLRTELKRLDQARQGK